jgi:hypothetical protein
MLLFFAHKLRLATLVLVALLSCAFVADAKPSEKQRLLLACAREFGPAVDRTQNLFEINPMFVLQAQFNRRGSLSEFAVKPKYFFNRSHPEWEEPNDFPLFSWADFQTLVARVDALKPKGPLTKPANDIAVITNHTGYFRETYRHGLLEWGEVGIGRRGKPENGVRFFTIRYFARAT